MNKDKKTNKKKGSSKIWLNMFILACFVAGAFLIYQAVIVKIDEKRTNETYLEIEELYNESIALYEEKKSLVSIEPDEPEPTTSANPDVQATDAPKPSQTPTPVVTATQKPENNQSPTSEPEGKLIPQREVADRSEVLEYFNPLLDVNEDIRGYIIIPGTNISYPVVQGIDNKFYLERNIYGKKTIAASIFMDYRNNVKKLDDNTIIYGHNLNTTMFNDLDYFVDESTRDEYLKTSSIFRFDTIYEVMSWEIYSAYIVDKDDFNYLTTNFRMNDKHQAFLDETMERSFVDTGIKVSVEDKILTLSTCNHWYNNSRTVIHARLITK